MKRFVVIVGSLLMLGACASAPKGNDAEALRVYRADPLEPMNRQVFKFNMTVDTYVLDPVAKGYRFITPQIVRTGVSNFLNNLYEPVTFVNNLLQFEFEKSVQTTGRFLTNTFLGVAGVFDVATNVGVPSNKTSFSETLAVWGFPEGPYLVLPFLGPSNVRRTVGLSLETFTDPVYLAAENAGVEHLVWTKDGIRIITVKEASLDLYNSMKKDSVDFYTTMRSTFQQNQKKLLEQDAQEKPSYEFEFDTEE